MRFLKELILNNDRDCELEGLREWSASFAGSDQQAWDQCPAGDWLLWMASAAGVERRSVVRAAISCLRAHLDEVRGAHDALVLRLLGACDAWLVGAGNTKRIRRYADELSAQLNDAEEQSASAALYDACMWISHLALEPQGMSREAANEGGLEGAMDAAPYMALILVAAAWARASGSQPGTPEWKRHLTDARRRCALSVRREIRFAQVEQAASQIECAA